MTPRTIEQLLPEALAPEAMPAHLEDDILSRTSRKPVRTGAWWAKRLTPLALAAVLAVAALLSLRVGTPTPVAPPPQASITDLTTQLLASLDAAQRTSDVDEQLALLDLELAQAGNAANSSTNLWLDVESEFSPVF